MNSKCKKKDKDYHFYGKKDRVLILLCCLIIPILNYFFESHYLRADNASFVFVIMFKIYINTDYLLIYINKIMLCYIKTI